MAQKYNGMEKYIFADVYNFFLKYKDIPNNDEYWNACRLDAQMLVEKYKMNYMAKEMMITTLHQLEHKICGTILSGYSYKQWEDLLGIHG